MNGRRSHHCWRRICVASAWAATEGGAAEAGGGAWSVCAAAPLGRQKARWDSSELKGGGGAAAAAAQGRQTREGQEWCLFDRRRHQQEPCGPEAASLLVPGTGLLPCRAGGPAAGSGGRKTARLHFARTDCHGSGAGSRRASFEPGWKLCPWLRQGCRAPRGILWPPRVEKSAPAAAEAKPGRLRACRAPRARCGCVC